MLGAHLSIAGGIHNALLKAEALGCSTVQVFTCIQSGVTYPQIVPSCHPHGHVYLRQFANGSCP